MVYGGGEGVAVESGLWLESLSDWTSQRPMGSRDLRQELARYNHLAPPHSSTSVK